MNYKFADIILPLKLNKSFCYQIPDSVTELKIGCRVLVSFGLRKFYTGIVVKLHDDKPEYDLKEIDSLIDSNPVVGEQQIKLWYWMSKYYMSSIGSIMSAALPSAFKLQSTSELILDFEALEKIEEPFSETSSKILSLLENKHKLKISEISFVDSKSVHKHILPLLNSGAVKVQESIYAKQLIKTKKYLNLAANELVDQFLNSDTKAKKQLAFVRALRELNKEVEQAEFFHSYNFSSAILKPLKEKGIVIQSKKTIDQFEQSEYIEKINSLSDAQSKALNEIQVSFQTKTTCLLHGVTSSGKTEVFIHLIKEYLNTGKQILYMLPEIAITTQIVSRLKKAFGNKICVYHSKLNATQRAEAWENIRTGKVQIILGVRSAVFLPFKSLSLIVVDEEHESSYKQYSATPYYHARDCAVVLATMFEAKCLLASATPSIESYFNSRRGKYGFVELKTRYQNFQLPEVKIIDKLHEVKKKTMVSIFTPQLYKAINQALKNGEQVILFQNRRGFSPYMQCEDCGEVLKCRNCDVSLTYHRYSNSLVCHYCAYTIGNRNSCQHCGSPNLRTKGYGTEKIADEIKIVFPNARVKRLDLDSTRNKNSHETIISQFENQELDILVGTQMVTKGLDFSNLSVVGVLDADSLMNYPDYKSFERSFQLMVQVSGRAGRSNGKGTVYIQTNEPKHPILAYVQRSDYASMYRSQLQERINFKYPPIVNLIKINLKHKKEEECDRFANKLAVELVDAFGPRVMGPETPVVNRIQTYFIRNIYVKLEKNQNTAIFKSQIINICKELKDKTSKSMNIIYDVDPA